MLQQTSCVKVVHKPPWNLCRIWPNKRDPPFFERHPYDDNNNEAVFRKFVFLYWLEQRAMKEKQIITNPQRSCYTRRQQIRHNNNTSKLTHANLSQQKQIQDALNLKAKKFLQGRSGTSSGRLVDDARSVKALFGQLTRRASQLSLGHAKQTSAFFDIAVRNLQHLHQVVVLHRGEFEIVSRVSNGAGQRILRDDLPTMKRELLITRSTSDKLSNQPDLL